MPLIAGPTRRSLPSKTAEGTNQFSRFGRYGEQINSTILGAPWGLCDEGTYFRAINATPETGIAAAITTTFSATAAFLCMTNGAAADGVRVFPHYIRMINKTVPASATRFEGLVAVDNISRFSSGGTAISALPNANGESATASAVSVLRVGAVVLVAESASVRRLSRFQLRTAIPVQFEEYMIIFGDATAEEFCTLGGTTAQRNVVHAGPVILGPASNSLTLHLWWPANAVTAGVWEFEMGWWER